MNEDRGPIFLKYLLLIVVLVSSVIFTNYRQTMQTYILDDINIIESDNNFVSEAKLLNMLSNNDINIDSIIPNSLTKQSIEDLIKTKSGVRNVEVFSNQKGGINVVVEQKKAIARIKSNTDDYFIDEYGEKIIRSSNSVQKLVVFTGDISYMDHVKIRDFTIKINKSDFWSALITQIHFEDNNIFLIPRLGSQKINIGDFENIETKLENLHHFYKVAMPAKGWQLYTEINLKYNNQIVCAKK